MPLFQIIMSNEFLILAATAAGLGFIHTITGPDHYLPFIAIAKARKWGLGKTLGFTGLCGAGHILSSVLIGLAGIALGIALDRLEWIESVRGSVIAWLFTAAGLVYLVWGIRKAIRNKPHQHLHVHPDGTMHTHTHVHRDNHLHVHEKAEKKNITPWVIFILFFFGPCEPLIPLVMFPALKHDYLSLAGVTLIFGLVTIGTMIAVVYAALQGFRFVSLKHSERYMHAIMGGTLLLCGLGMLVLGL